MRIDGYLDRLIGQTLLALDSIKRAEHVSSGKLSASALGNPLQWQILKSLAVERGDIDEYTLRKFQRGNHVEDWYLGLIPGVIKKQTFVEYRKVVGYLDAFVSTESWDFENLGDLPLEVKSVTNAKFKRITTQGAPDHSHALQCALYALAEGTPFFAVSYIAADDYRVLTYVLNTEDFKAEIDGIIDLYDQTKARGIIPVFEAKEKWQMLQKYNDYYEWSKLNAAEIGAKVRGMGMAYPIITPVYLTTR
jgi:hypothetical protein